MLYREVGYRWGIAATLNRLGMVASGLKEYDRAASALVEALSIAMEARALTVAVTSMAAMAGLLAKAGDKTVALEYASLALNHPACDVQTQNLAQRIMSELEAELPMGEFMDGVKRGKARELKEVAAAILKQ